MRCTYASPVHSNASGARFTQDPPPTPPLLRLPAAHLDQLPLVCHALELHAGHLLPVGRQLALVLVTNVFLDGSAAGASALRVQQTARYDKEVVSEKGAPKATLPTEHEIVDMQQRLDGL